MDVGSYLLQEGSYLLRLGSYLLEDGSYLRFKNISVGYNFSSSLLKKMGMTGAKFYVSGQNLITITNYSGYDPEIGGVVFGVDRGVYPQARSFIGGVQLQF